MESLAEQTDLEGLLYQEAPQPAASLALQQGVNLEQSLPGTAPVSVGTFSHPQHCQQLEGGQTEHLLAEGGENEGRNSLHTGADGASAGPAHVDHTSQLEETRMILSSGALDIAARRSLLLGRTKQRHVCHVCGRECPSKHKLKRHLSTHSEDRPFSCHVCGKSFKWTEYLQKHMRQQHSGGEVSPSNGTASFPTILSPSTSSTSPPHSSPTSQHYQHASTSSVSVSTDHGTSMDVTIETLATSMGTSVDHEALGDGSVFSTDMQQDGTSMQEVGEPSPQPPPTTDLLTQPQSITPTEMIPIQPNPPTSLPDTALQTAVAQLSQFGISIPVSGTEQPLPLAEFHSETGNEMTGLDQSAAALSQHLSNYSMVLNNTQPVSQTNDVLSSMPPPYMEMHSAIYEGHPEMTHNMPGYHSGQQLGTGYQQLGTGSLNMAAFQQSLTLPQPHAVSQPTAITASTMYNDTTTTSTYDSTTPTATPTTIIVREDMDGGEERPAKRPRKECVDVGIQCEVGHETLVALREEEEQARQQGGGVYSQAELEIDASAIHISDSSNQQVLVLQQGGFHEGGERQYLEGDEGAVVEADVNMSSKDMMSPTDPLKDDKVVHKYPCEVDNCKKAYIHRKDLIRHMKIRHGVSPKKLEPVAMETPEKPYVCSVGFCGRSYFHMKDLRRHQRQCHTVSLGAFVDAVPDDMLDTGMEVKSQLRYPCDFPGCARSYVHKKDLVRHKRLFHKDSSSKPSVPVPIRYTESELKRIRQDFKVEIDRMVDKIRLDSTGSTASTTSGGDDLPNSATTMETEVTESELASGGTAPEVVTESVDGSTSTANAQEFHPSSLITSVANAIIHSLPLSSNSTAIAHCEETSNATDLLTMQGTVVPEHHILQTLHEAPAQLAPPQAAAAQQEQQQPIVSEATPSVYTNTGNMAYTFATASGSSEYSFAETHPLSSLQPTPSHPHQDQHSGINHQDPNSADQYDPTAVLNAISTSNSDPTAVLNTISASNSDPTAVLNTISTSNSNELQATSLQSVAQIFAPPTASEASELTQGSF